LDCVEDVGDDEDEDDCTIFMKKLRGETKEIFESLLFQLGEAKALLEEKEDTIIELEGHARDHADKIAELEDDLVEEQILRESLEETQALDLSKVKETRDGALETSRDYKIKYDELLVGHNKLLEDLEQLEVAHKAISHELTSLKESYDTLQVQFLYSYFTTPHNASNANACATNSLCDKASLIEENTRLKAQLEKGLATCIQGEKNLNDLLSNQKGVVGKEGLGFAPKSKKANKKKKPTPPSKDIVFVKEGELAKEKETNTIVGGDATRGNATHNDFAGKYNPSYVLMKSRDGNVYAN